ncbi:PrsW family intramembrane metalloprotease [Candidatus Gracilibacteria bacterium]|jgi:RsiW-degrading membrane proteinase PrsW (M82 family)|nr:PrsW family intramembrane metalloprotease [Candidatus Gracilibacteria bacterium]
MLSISNPTFLLTISTIFAAIPAAVWLYIFFKKTDQGKGIVALVFGLGCLTPPALLALQWLWAPPIQDVIAKMMEWGWSAQVQNVIIWILTQTSKFDLAAFTERTFTGYNSSFIAMFILFAALEEIIKMYVIIAVDKRTLLIKTLGDSIKFALASALGFAFAENIYYLYQYWPTISSGELINMYVFRSLFTACAHMIFSSIFGYHYGIGKFAININAQKKVTGSTASIFEKIISKVLGLPLSQAFQQKMVLKGLFLAIFIHATYNYLLQFNKILPVIIFVILGYAYLKYLLGRKAGNLMLIEDISTKQKSNFAKKDEEVVLELIGMWFNEKRYVDVIHICERLLERDPDNNVIKLFKAKALDRLDDKDTYKTILSTVVKAKDEVSANDKNILSKYVTEKEKNRTTQDPNAQASPQVKQEETIIKAPEKDILSKFTGGDSFKM